MSRTDTTPTVFPPHLTKLGWTSYSNKQEWKDARRAFTVTASAVGNVLGYGGNSRKNQALRTAVVNRLTFITGDDKWQAYLPPTNEFALAVMNSGSENEEVIHQQVNPGLPTTITLIPHPTLKWMSCSPDALDLTLTKGHEYKTRVLKLVLPQEIHDIDPIHYLQVQTSMHCTAPYITTWTLSYNILRQPKISSFLIEYDEALMTDIERDLSQFNDRAECICADLMSRITEFAAPTEITFNAIFDKWKYECKRKRSDKSSNHNSIEHKVTESIKTHVTKYE